MFSNTFCLQGLAQLDRKVNKSQGFITFSICGPRSADQALAYFFECSHGQINQNRAIKTSFLQYPRHPASILFEIHSRCTLRHREIVHLQQVWWNMMCFLMDMMCFAGSQTTYQCFRVVSDRRPEAQKVKKLLYFYKVLILSCYVFKSFEMDIWAVIVNRYLGI